MEFIPGDLPAHWRERGAFLREYGDPSSGRLWDLAASELERTLGVQAAETLSLAEAARLSGFSADHLGQLVKRGKIPNAGRTGAPRIRREDIPQKKAGGPGRPSRPKSVDRERIRRIAQSFTEEA